MKFSKRIGYSLLNELILFPLIVVLVFLSLLIMILGLSSISDSIGMFGYILLGILLFYINIFTSPIDALETLNDWGYMSQLIIWLILFVAIISLIRSLIYSFADRDLIGENIVLRRIGQEGEKCKFGRLFLRTFLKYLSLFIFLPTLLFPLFNKQRLFLHEWASGVCKIETMADKTEPPSKNTVNIDDEKKKFYENEQCE